MTRSSRPRQNYFAEIIRENLTDTLGTVEWLCDVPAGAWIAFEILDLGNTSAWSASSFYQVQPGTTDACLRRNEGQKAVESMAALASSLSSASPQLFTYPACVFRCCRPGLVCRRADPQAWAFPAEPRRTLWPRRPRAPSPPRRPR